MKQEEHKQEFDRSKYIAGIDPIVEETLEEGYERVYDSIDYTEFDFTSFKLGAKRQAERMYTYDEIRTIAYNAYCKGQLDNPTEGEFNLWIQQFKKK
jgi:hypothetical protein